MNRASSISHFTAGTRKPYSIEAEAIMKKRGRIERVNANFKNRGFGALLVRGLAKVQAIGLWHALAHNLTIALRLRAMAASVA